MTKELVISASRSETRVAVLEDDQVVEIYFQRENEYSLAGSIHKGRVTRVLPGMQSAFVNIGLERDAFLYVSDFFEDNEEYDKIVTSVEEKVLKLDKAAPPAPVVEAAPVPEAEETVEPVEQEPAAPVAAPPPRHVPQHNQQDDRRGRRRRRRQRGGGRGIPESKFFLPAAPPAAEEPTDVAVEDDFAVLPGESLAKYTRPGEEPEEPEMTGLEPAGEEASPEPPEVEAEPVADTTAEADAPEMETATPEHSGQMEPLPEEPTLDAAPEAQAEDPPVAEPDTEELRAEEPSVEEPPIEDEAADEIPIDEYEEALAEDTAEAATVEEPASGQMPLGEHGTEEEAAAEPEEPETGEAAGVEPARIPTSLTATLREQGMRYGHRVTRRMRRRGGRQSGEERQQERPPRQEARQESRQERAARAERPAQASISDLLREGQEIIVQIAKEPLGQKGARITSHIALPGRFLVYMPTVDHIGVSRKIASDDERQRLKRVLQSNRSGIPGGYIVRTAGEGHSEEELRADMLFLYNLWLDMRQKAEKRPAPALIHHDLDVVERILRDQLTSHFKTIWVDNEEIYENVLSFVQRFQPALVGRVKMYTRRTPIFDQLGITPELEKALRPKVWLKSGGYIVINQTEALVAIDINTGKFVGKSNRLEDTIVKTNTEAIKEIVRQIRLRDLGGIIVVDFIDMDERKNRQKVMQTLEEAMRADRAPNKILSYNDFGLVAITRKRVKQSLERTLCAPCPYCEGAGYVKSVQTVIGEILIEAQKIAKAVEPGDVMLRVNPEVAKVLKSNRNTYLQELEEILGRNVIVKGDSQLHQERFDLA
jgi:ribonuclease G